MSEFISLINATGVTLSLAFSALVLGLLLAMLFATGESSRFKAVRYLSLSWVTLIRGLPEILVVLCVYFGTSQLLMWLADGFNINMGLFSIPIQIDIENFDVSPFLCGVIALALLYSAYASQTLRGAINAVPQGQWEAGFALGFKRSDIFIRFILPQMWRHALPGLANQWLVLLKDTALVSLISVNDLMLQTKSIAARTHEPFTWYLIVAAIYLLITLVTQKVINKMEQHISAHLEGNKSC